jgi:hypothetical protein
MEVFYPRPQASRETDLVLVLLVPQSGTPDPEYRGLTYEVLSFQCTHCVVASVVASGTLVRSGEVA